MIKIVRESSEAARDLLAEQGYDIAYAINFILKRIINNDSYPGISLAYNSDYSDKYSVNRVEEFAKDFVTDYIIPAVEKAGPDYEWDYDELFDEVLKKEESEVNDLEREFEDLVDKQRKDWQDEIDYMNREYWRSNYD